MADYHPLITRAVSALEKDTAESRRVLYERARSALLAQLRGTTPPLEEAEITRERLALEEAIRKVEVESARRARETPRAKSAAPKRAIESAFREPLFKREEIVKREESAKSAPSSPPETPTIAAEPAAIEPAHITNATRIKSAPPEIFAKTVPASPSEDEPAPKPVVSESTTISTPSEFAAKSVVSEPVRNQKPQRAEFSKSFWQQDEPNKLLDDALKEFREVVGTANTQEEVSRSASLPQPLAPMRSAPIVGPATSPPALSRRKKVSAPPPSSQTPPLQPAPPSRPAELPMDPIKALESFEPRLAQEDWPVPAAEAARPTSRLDVDEAHPVSPPEQLYPPIDDRVRPPRSLRSYRRLVWVMIALVVICGGGALAYLKGSAIVEAGRSLVGPMRAPTTQAQRDTIPSRPKDPARVGQPDATPPTGIGAATTQRAMLTTEPDANNPRGRDYVGRAVWRTETLPAAPGRAAELAIKLEVEIPDRGFAMTWLIRRNTDASLPASHTIDIEFNLAPNSPLGRVAEIKSMLMKQPGQVEGSPLWGHAQRSTPNYFLVGLSAVEADAQYNLKLLKEQPAFDVALVFSSVGRAFLLIEKGPIGEKIFAEAFAAWKQ